MDYLGCLCLGLSHKVPHSCLEYGTWVIGIKKDLVQLNLWLGGMLKSLTWLAFTYVSMSYFPIIIYEHFHLLLFLFDGVFFMVNILFIC